MEKLKSIHVWIYAALIAGLVTALVWGAGTAENAKALEITNENAYNRAFFEMTDHVDKINNLLSKARLANGAAQMAKLSGDIFRESTAAKACLGELPTTQINLENTSKFLSQVGDYTYVLSQNMINGEPPSDEDYDHLARLNDYAASLSATLTETEGKIANGEIHISDRGGKGRINEKTAEAAGGDVLTDLENVEKSFEEYPSLIYDGPFSEHIENRKPALLENADNISQADALKKAEEFLGESGGLVFSGLSENTAIPAYNFTGDKGGRVSVSVTRKGGYILSYLNDREVGDAVLDISEATARAAEFLQSKGFYSMQQSYYDKLGSIATINFAFVQDNVTCYSDLVKVRVALDNGEIIGIETNGYIMNHTERELAAPQLTMEDARGFVSRHLDVKGTKLTLIPKDSMREVLCYEFKGAFAGKNFLVYVNADNGREEEIFILVENEEGVLTV